MRRHDQYFKPCTASSDQMVPTPQKNNRLQMGFASRKPSLPFTLGKSRSNSYIPFAEFEAAYSAEHAESCEQETETPQPPQQSADLSVSKRAWNLMSLFPRANAAAAITWESNSQKEANPSLLDRVPKVGDVKVEGLNSGIGQRSEDSKRPANVSSLFSIGEESVDAPSISTTSSTQLSNSSCTKSDIVNAVETVPSEETVLSMNLGSVDIRRSCTSIGLPKDGTTEASEPSPGEVCSQPVRKSDVAQKRSSFDTSKSHSEEVRVQEKVHSIRRGTKNEIPKVEKNAEREMAELILRRKKLLARKEGNKPASS